MTAALTTFKNILDSYVAPLESPIRAYRSGDFITACCLGHPSLAINQGLEEGKLSNLFSRTLGTLSLILEAKRLKIFEGTRWEKPFVTAAVTLIFSNVLVFYKNYLENSFLGPVVEISKLSLQAEFPIKGITKLAFTIFEFHHRPKEVAICFLSGCVSLIENREWTPKIVKTTINIINFIICNCGLGIRLYLGNRFEQALISTSYLVIAFKS